jgi:hypothetical protein
MAVDAGSALLVEPVYALRNALENPLRDAQIQEDEPSP